jgi:protein TonB
VSAFAVSLAAPRDDTARWSVCLAIVLAAHAAGALALLSSRPPASQFDAGAPVIMIELPDVSLSVPTLPNDLAPGPVEAESDPTPIKEETKPLEQEAEVALPIPEPKPKPPTEQKQATALPSALLPSAPSPPVAGAAVQPSTTAINRWESELVAHIERFKRYPAEARAHGTQGRVRVAFTVDRDGWVQSSRIVQSSGSPELDQESLAMLTRAQPMPHPPARIADRDLSFVVPVMFNIR